MRRFGLILLCALSLVAQPLPARAAPDDTAGRTALSGKPGPGVPARAPMDDAASRNAWRSAPAVTWPAPGVAEVKATEVEKADADAPKLTRAGTLPIWLGQSATVRLLRSGKDSGVVFSITGAAGRAPIEVDYTGFRHAFGGDYAARLKLVRLDGQPITSNNDPIRGRVTTTGADGVYALVATSSSSAGSYRATSLAPSATWQVGLNSGDFTWSYPITLPQLPGPVPDLSLSYNSGAVDGRTGSTNNQPSVVGEGFDLRTGYIERSYHACDQDGQAGVADLCYLSPNAVAVLPDFTTELVRDKDTGTWAAQRESGWRIEQLFGASNGDNDGEHWRLTSPGGVQYFFGSSASASSAWTAPVYGDDGGEPCHQATFAASWCQQTYRWMLDKVVDPHGDAITYSYEKETNNYSRAGTITPYVRSGHLVGIEYAGGAARVVVTVAGRCLPGSTCASSEPANFPDVPYDQECGTSSCAYLAPTFWSSKRLAKITTQVNSGSGFRDVDSWTLTHSFPGTGSSGADAAPALWLESITRAGHVGGTVTLPPMRFAGTMQRNRLEAIDGKVPLNKYRIHGIVNETGGQIKVNYSLVDCVAGSTPAPDSNVRKCFPAFWSPGGTGPALDWFHKYVVNEVIEEDLVAGRTAKVTQYEYLDPGAVLWSHDNSEILPATQQSWGQWRGYQRVRVRTGGQSVTEYLFLRGLYDDRDADGDQRLITVDGVEDRAAFSGMVRQTAVFDESNVISRTTSQPRLLGTTATRPRASGTLEATLADEVSERTLITLAGGGTRTVEKRFGYDSRGRLLHTSDLGDTSTTADDSCVRNTYTENTTTWIINTIGRVETLDAACDATGTTLTDVKNTYSDAGDLTRVEEWNGSGFVTASRTVPDRHGRPLEQYDALGHVTRTAYTPATGGPVTRTVRTNPLGHSVTTDFEPLRGTVSSTEDANGNVTRTGYDALGRLTAVWLPGRATTATANVRHEYLVRASGPSVVTTRPLIGPVSHELYDGLLRPAQTQTGSPTGGRIVTDTVYDGAGRVSRDIDARWDAGLPGTSLLAVPTTPNRETRYSYDGAGRVTGEALYSGGVQQWRTTTAYGGDRVDVDPPQGGTATTSILDGHGRTVELRQYAGGAPTGAYDATRYTYTRLGQLQTITDPAGNVRRNTYDSRGRQIRAEAPTTGTVVLGYDDADRLISRTDARGRTLTYGYDDLDRRTALREGASTLAEWAYDTAPGGKGLLASSTRHSGGAAYVSAVTGYDERGRRKGTAVTVPAAETGLAGTYTTTFTYHEDDQPATTTLPAVGGLAQETLTHGYDALGNPDTLTGLAAYVADTTYDELGALDSRSSGPAGRQVHRNYDWDQATRWLAYLSAYRDVEAGPTLADRAYGYDATGNVTSIVDNLDDTADRQCFRYDQLQRLVQAWTPAGECSGSPTTGNLSGPAPYWHDYSYDKIGNRLAEVWHAAAGNTTRTYAYQAAQPHLVRSVTTNGSTTASYGYDASGNTTSRLGQAVSWDAEGRVATSGAESTVYDADGNQLVRRDSAGTTVYLGHTEVRRATSGSVTATRYYGQADSVVAVRTPARLSWLVDDHQGTATVAVADQAGQPTARRYQLPFGATRGATPTWWDGERRFVGGTVGPAGLIHLGARDYDPAIGRFLSADPIVDTDDPQQMHGYSYANGSPVTLSDPDGLKAKKSSPRFPAKKDSDRLRGIVIDRLLSQPYDDYFVCEGCGWEYYGDTIWDIGGYYDDSYGYDTYDEPQVRYTYQQTECGGWGGQCVTPRPYEWVADYDAAPVSPYSPAVPPSSWTGGGGTVIGYDLMLPSWYSISLPASARSSSSSGSGWGSFGSTGSLDRWPSMTWDPPRQTGPWTGIGSGGVWLPGLGSSLVRHR
ncbi:RHS repeat-associated core domain-containing protein [Plantactinospora sp. ZYX-F-223]|uniref:RHS repeat-associated core domain-containing protein n=1 Tax=Plantactinospora sp. ZYX-F-223 TaxID=3144103 RepID=UPI0031FD8C58